jgi:hypothetical protein
MLSDDLWQHIVVSHLFYWINFLNMLFSSFQFRLKLQPFSFLLLSFQAWCVVWFGFYFGLFTFSFYRDFDRHISLLLKSLIWLKIINTFFFNYCFTFNERVGHFSFWFAGLRLRSVLVLVELYLFFLYTLFLHKYNVFLQLKFGKMLCFLSNLRKTFLSFNLEVSQVEQLVSMSYKNF